MGVVTGQLGRSHQAVAAPRGAGDQRRLALLFDGTWNTPDVNSSVWRLKLMLAARGDDGVPQIAYYDPGVGTRWYDRLTGGAFGAGLSQNVQEGYAWLVENYNQGDDVFLFGFSRGAFTARSLSGFIARCGLLAPGSPLPVGQAFERYRTGDAARTLYKLLAERDQWWKDHPKHTLPPSFSREDRWVAEYSRPIAIEFIGVWDTVKALGVPGNIPGIGTATLSFHNTQMSKMVKHGYQALAIDEHRRPYKPILWTSVVPKAGKPEELPLGSQKIEQRWFMGAHANVGGGYKNDPLGQMPLDWLQQKAKDHDLASRADAEVSPDDHLGRVRDSYREFLYGTWEVATLGRRYYRPIVQSAIDTAEGEESPVNESIDDSVFQRFRADKCYRPRNLLDWAKRAGIDLNAVASWSDVQAILGGRGASP